MLFHSYFPVRSSLRIVCVGIALLAVAAPTASFAAESPLTLAEAQRRALAQSSLLAAQDSVVAAAREMAVAAGELPDPVLRFGVDNLPVDGPDRFSIGADFMTMRRIGLMQEWTRAAKREARMTRFEREADKARSDHAAAAATIQRDVALAWIDRYYAEAIVAVIATQAAEAKLEIEAAEAAYRGGRGSQADVFLARSAVAGLEDRASEARRRVATAIASLGRWVGAAADAPLAGTPPHGTLDLEAKTLVMQLERHPAVLALAQQQQVAAADARVAQANRDPDWTFEIAYQQRGSAFSNMMSVGVSVPLPWNRARRQDRELAAKLALVDEARALRDDALRMYTAQVRVLLAEWETGRERLNLHANALVPLSRQRTSATAAAYRGARGSLTEVLAARRSELDVHRDALGIEQDTARAWAQLNFLGIGPVAAPATGSTTAPPLLRAKETP